MIRAVTFDLWNTLIKNKDFTETRINALREALEEEGLSFKYSELMEAYEAASDLYRRDWEKQHTHLPVDRRVEHVLERLGAPETEDLKDSIVNSFMNAYTEDPPAIKEGVEETLEALDGLFRMGIISDTGVTPGSIIRDHLKDLGLLRHFTSTIFSDEIGYCKPNSRVFERALSELNSIPNEAVHVGDLLRTDVAGAKMIGMKAVWLSDSRGKPQGEHLPDFVIRHLPELLNILDEL